MASSTIGGRRLRNRCGKWRTGTGLRVNEYKRLIEAGYQAITLGDHIYKKCEIVEVLNGEANIVKPANFPPTAPGKTWCVVETEHGPLAIFSLLGRVFMRPVDCPMLAADRVLSELPASVKMILVEIHAEATSDKQVMGRYLDGRVSAAPLATNRTRRPRTNRSFPVNGFPMRCGDDRSI